MSAHKHIDKICVAGILLALVITVLFMNGEKLGIVKTVNGDAEGYEATEYFTSNDLNASAIDFSDSVKITLEENSASVSGSGAYVWDDEVRIVRSGYYSISGTSDRYRIVVDAEEYSKVWLEFNGVSLTCADDACLQIERADKVFLILAEGSENTLTSGEVYNEEAVEEGHNGTIYARDDLTIAGSGILNVSASFKHGIKANDDLAITGGVIRITAQGDGIHANSSIRIREAELTVNAEDDGLQTDEADSFIYVESGTAVITSADDAIKSAGAITVDGGSFRISAGDDGIHSDTEVCISDGVIAVENCYEGIEAERIEIAGGDITIFPQDDGINANGSESGKMGMNHDGFMTGDQNLQETEQLTAPSSEPIPEEPEQETEEECYIRISGGTVVIINETAQDADGLDSNGGVIIEGGKIHISLAGSGSNNAIDYGSESGGTAVINGGTVLAAGSSTMAEAPDSSGTQVSFMYNLASLADAGTLITLRDSSGNVLLSETLECSFSSVIISTPELVLGNTYTLSVGETEETITADEVSSVYGNAQSMTGWMNPGGMHSNDGQMPDFSQMRDGEFPQMGELPADGERPQMGEKPEGMNRGERPERTQNTDIPSEQLPESETAADASAESDGQMRAPDGMKQEEQIQTERMDETEEQERPEAEADNEAVTEEAASGSDEGNLILAGISAAVLLGGILFAGAVKGKSVFS